MVAGGDLSPEPALCPPLELQNLSVAWGDLSTVPAALLLRVVYDTAHVFGAGDTLLPGWRPCVGGELATCILGETIYTYAEHKHMLMMDNYTPYL